MMKVPFNMGIRGELSRSSADYQHPARIIENRDVGNYPKSFGRLLSDNLHKKADQNTFPKNVPPLSKIRLEQLIKVIEMQFKDSMTSIFEESDDVGVGQGDQLDWSNTSLADNRLLALTARLQELAHGAAPVSRADIDRMADYASRTYDVDPALTKAVIKAESDYDPASTSNKGAMGLMQLMPDTAREIGVENPYDPLDNIMGGTRYLKGLLDRYNGDIPSALAAYNWGMGNLERHPSRMPRETRTYVTRVGEYYRGAKANREVV